MQCKTHLCVSNTWPSAAISSHWVPFKTHPCVWASCFSFDIIYCHKLSFHKESCGWLVSMTMWYCGRATKIGLVCPPENLPKTSMYSFCLSVEGLEPQCDTQLQFFLTLSIWRSTSPACSQESVDCYKVIWARQGQCRWYHLQRATNQVHDHWMVVVSSVVSSLGSESPWNVVNALKW